MVDSICIAHGEPIGLGYGGSVRVVSLARSLAVDGYDVHLVAPTSTESEMTQQELEDVTLHPVRISSRGAIDQIPRALLISRRAKSVRAEYNAQLQVERGTLAGIGTYMGLSDYIVDLHDIGFNGPLYANLPLSTIVQRFVCHMEHRGVERASHVIAVSDRMAKYVQSEWNIDPGKIHVVHNGVRRDILDLEPDTNEIEGQISFIGSLNYNINYDKIIKLATEIDGAKIHVIGDGYKRGDLESSIKQREVDDVIVHGFLPDQEAYKILGQSQVCIFPLMDTHHTKVAQHMKGFDYGAMGKAIATDQDGTAEILEANDAALVSNTSDPSEFISNVCRLLEDHELRERLGTNARGLAEEYQWQNQGKKLVDLYEREF